MIKAYRDLFPVEHPSTNIKTEAPRKPSKAPESVAKINAPKTPHHSIHSAQKSDHYAKVIGNSTRAIDGLNPTKAKQNPRSFPGLANGE